MGRGEECLLCEPGCGLLNGGSWRKESIARINKWDGKKKRREKGWPVTDCTTPDISRRVNLFCFFAHTAIALPLYAPNSTPTQPTPTPCRNEPSCATQRTAVAWARDFCFLQHACTTTDAVTGERIFCVVAGSVERPEVPNMEKLCKRIRSTVKTSGETHGRT